LRDDLDKFSALDAEVYGVNPASPEAHQKYAEKKEFQFKLLSDSGRTVAESYKALKENGKSIERTVYVIDRAGKITFARRGIPSDDQILESIIG
jgi:peroxiredoxin